MEDRVLNAALAGLLHDIGKFSQRADIGASRSDEIESEYGYKHALYSGDFVERYLPAAFKPLSPPAYHHAPKTDFDRLVQLADHLSANERAIDRSRNPKQLLSIFCQIKAKEDGKELLAPGKRYHALHPLELKEGVLFPQEQVERDETADFYKALWDGEERRVPWLGFIKEAQVLKEAHTQQPDIAVYLESMLLLMQRYTWCIPSAYYHNAPDISLYDHSRTTAAIAACLTAHGDEQIQRWLQGREQTAPAVALLVVGDISGIQNFIFTITSKGAASALRGRSLYLQLLTEAIARYVLRRLKLPSTNLLFAGGGHFFLLARHNDGDEFDKIRQEVSRILLAFHSGDLYLALESVSLAVGEFKGMVLSEKWKQVGEKLRRAKTRKFGELEDDLRPLVFQLSQDKGNDQLECQVCGREHKKTEERDGVRKCPQCCDFEEWGKGLRAARYLRLNDVDFSVVHENAPPGTVGQALHCFGIMAQLDESIPAMPAEAQRSVIYALRDDAFSGLKPDAHTAVGRRYFVNVTPTIAGAEELERLRQRGVRDLPEVHGVKPFEALEAESRGFKRLGVLRVDVDDMGKIISAGLGELATFSRIATLSFMINLFFEGWAAELARRYNREGGADADRVYSIYSGGDDLFFVGAWDVVPELALDICDDLRKFVGGHPGIHASAGIALVGGKYPLYQAAEDAHEALDAAKDRPGKNAISFLGQAVRWETFERVHAQMLKLRQLIEDQRAPRALLQRLAQFHRQFARKRDEMLERGKGENRAGEEQVYWGPWHWRSAYFLSRLKVDGETAKQEVVHLRDQLSGENFRAIEWIGLAAHWADLLTR